MAIFNSYVKLPEGTKFVHQMFIIQSMNQRNEHFPTTTQHRDKMMTGDCDWQARKKHKTLPSMTVPMPQEVNKVYKVKTCFFAGFKGNICRKPCRDLALNIFFPAHVPIHFWEFTSSSNIQYFDRPGLLPMQRQLPELHKGSNQSTQVLRSAAHVLLHRFVRTPHRKSARS